MGRRISSPACVLVWCWLLFAGLDGLSSLYVQLHLGSTFCNTSEGMPSSGGTASPNCSWALSSSMSSRTTNYLHSSTHTECVPRWTLRSPSWSSSWSSFREPFFREPFFRYGQRPERGSTGSWITRDGDWDMFCSAGVIGLSGLPSGNSRIRCRWDRDGAD